MPAKSSLIMLLSLVSVCFCLSIPSVLCAEPNPPVWPASVSIFDPSNPSATQSALDAIFAENGGHNPPLNGQFSSSRFALLFLPGHHTVTANIGYYTTLAGLGKNPQDTTIDTVQVENGDFDYTIGALDNFWRSAENFHTIPTQTWNGVPNSMLWAVSQSSPLRSVSVDGNLALYEYNSGCCAGYASGGFLADAVVSGTLYSGSQQQWISRNVQMGKWDGGVWNQVFVGCTGGVPSEHCSNSGGLPYSVESSSPVIAEKPYITYNAGKYSLVIPPVENAKTGISANRESWLTVGFEQVYVATSSDSAATITAKMAQGMHVVFSPGIYQLNDSIVVSKSDVVLLGLGMATLISGSGQPVIAVDSGVDGVRIAGLLIEAGKEHSLSLMSIGSSSSSPRLSSSDDSSSDPIVLSDVFFRVGGPTNSVTSPVSTAVMLHITSSNVIIDNTWLWRADHDVQGNVINGNNPVSTGLLVEASASNVTAYGLAAEHTLQDLVVWQGANGKVFFYQSEFPYDVTAAYGQQNYTSYRVSASAAKHYAVGTGAYCYFRDNVVTIQNGFVSEANDSQIRNPLTVFLSGNGGIEHVWNGQGAAVTAGGQSEYVCQGNAVNGFFVPYRTGARTAQK